MFHVKHCVYHSPQDDFQLSSKALQRQGKALVLVEKSIYCVIIGGIGQKHCDYGLDGLKKETV